LKDIRNFPNKNPSFGKGFLLLIIIVFQVENGCGAKEEKQVKNLVAQWINYAAKKLV
jgi:hypothetical protein